MITIPEDYTGKFELSKGMFSFSKLQTYIDRYEARYLRELLGVELYNEFESDLIDGIPQSPNFIKIFTEFAEDVGSFYYTYNRYYQFNDIIDSAGIYDMLQGFIYFEYSKDLKNQMTPYGNVKQNAENSEVVNTLFSTMYNRYNESIKSFDSIQQYILLNQNTPTGQIVTMDILNGGQGYVSGTNLTLNYATQLVTDGAIQSLENITGAGTGYDLVGETNVPLLGGSGVGATIDYIGDGAGSILSWTINQAGTGYLLGEQLTVDSGNLDFFLNIDALVYYSEYISEVTGSGATADVEVTDGVITDFLLSGPGEGFSDGEYTATGGTGTGAVFAVTVDPLDPLGQVLTIDLVDGGSGYSEPDQIFIQGTSLPLELKVTFTDSGIINSVIVNEGGKDYKVGDVLTIDGGDGQAQFEVTYIGKGDFKTFKGKRKLTAYWL